MATKRDELRYAAAPWIADLESLQAAYRRALRDQLKLDEAAIPRQPDPGAKSWVDVAVSWTIFLTGACLLLGSVYSPGGNHRFGLFAVRNVHTAILGDGSEPDVLAVPTGRVAGLLLLAVSGAGRFAGLDYFRCLAKIQDTASGFVKKEV